MYVLANNHKMRVELLEKKERRNPILKCNYNFLDGCSYEFAIKLLAPI